MRAFGSKSGTSPPNGAIQPADARCGKWRTPLRPDSIALQTASRPTPIGETIPSPVITTSRSATMPSQSARVADESTKTLTWKMATTSQRVSGDSLSAIQFNCRLQSRQRLPAGTRPLAYGGAAGCHTWAFLDIPHGLAPCGLFDQVG